MSLDYITKFLFIFYLDPLCYHLSNLGEKCKYPVLSDIECKYASQIIGATYVMSEGNGHDLPFGCLLNDENLMYWNPRGIAISADKKIRQICQAKGEIAPEIKIYCEK